MPVVYLARTPIVPHALIAERPDSQEKVERLKHGRLYRCEIKEIRNPDHHRKYFALVNAAYECWEPPLRDDVPAKYADIDISKSVDLFRKDCQILAGYYDAHYRLDGSVRVESKSINYATLDQTAFDELYAAVEQVIANMIPERRRSDKLKGLLQ